MIDFMQQAVKLSQYSLENGGGPFGCVIVKNNIIAGKGTNRVTLTNDPTAHAEIIAIRNACNYLNTFQLNDCILYSSCEPCPMCLAAIYWAKIPKIYFANSRYDAAAIDFDDSFIYDEIAKNLHDRKIEMCKVNNIQALKTFENWKNKSDKIKY